MAASPAPAPLLDRIPERPAPAPVIAQPAVGITGARRMMLETLVVEIDDLRKQLADATKKPGK
jgi:hypothetical protein